MSPIALGLDLLLIVLLLVAAGIGLKLNARLKTLRASQLGFVKAVQELDTAAARAEAGLNALRAAQDQTHDSLLTRIETARGLITRLEQASARAAGLAPAAPIAAAAPLQREAAPLRTQAPAFTREALRNPRAILREIDDDLFEDVERSPLRRDFRK